jgi:TonB family protein
MKRPRSSSTLAFAAAAMLVAAAAAHAQDHDLSTARELYASAAYDDALTVLNRLRSAAPAGSDTRAIEQYRAFCLLALGRTADAEQAIEAVVTAEPGYQPSAADVSPRIRSAFADVRRRMLPAIIQQKYADAKSAFDRKEFAAAAQGFSEVLVTLADPDVGQLANKPPLSDLRTLAVGFEELSAKAAAPPPPPPPPPPPAPVVPATPLPPRVYGPDDPGVVPPAPLNQVLPTFRGPNVPLQRTGKLEIIIDETGSVESAVMLVSVTAAYDKQALAAAREWRYMPATARGVPVKFRKIVQITVKPTT